VIKRTILIILACLILLPPAARAKPAVPATDREAEMRAAVATYLQQKTAGLGCEVTIRRLTIGGSHQLPEGRLEYEVIAPQQWQGWGSAAISLIVRQGERVVQNIPLRVEVEAQAEMVVAVRQIDHGSIIVASDLALRKQDLASVRGRYLGSIEDVAGKKARTTLRANSAVKADQLERIPLVKSGQMVTIVAENERMRITVIGKARGSGAEGDTINVQNMNSLKEIPARIIDAGTVLVVF
jgi:flagella basal body P-ring formation protein FlgA